MFIYNSYYHSLCNFRLSIRRSCQLCEELCK